MTEFINLADEEEHSTISEAYLVKLAEYRRRLMLLRDELFRLNAIVENAVCDPAMGTRH